MIDRLDEFLAASARKRWCWERANCGLWAADWCVLATGRDPAAELRGLAATAGEWEAVAAQRGGMLTMFEAAMGVFARTYEPVRGDVAVVQPPEGLAAAICVAPGRFVARTLRGLRAGEYPLLTAWRLA